MAVLGVGHCDCNGLWKTWTLPVWKLEGPIKIRGAWKATSPSRSLVPALFLTSPNFNFSVYKMKRLWRTSEIISVKHLHSAWYLAWAQPLLVPLVHPPLPSVTWEHFPCGLLKVEATQWLPQAKRGGGWESECWTCHLPLTTCEMGAR